MEEKTPTEAPEPPVLVPPPGVDMTLEGLPEAPPEKPKPGRKRRKFTYKVLLFEKYDLSEVVVHDPGLARHINLSPLILPHTGGRYAAKPFAKSKMNIVERLVNNMMRTEDFTGKKAKAIRVVRLALEKIAAKTKGNPVQAVVDALEKAAPREEVTRLRFGGISVPRAVDVAPSRRLDMALRTICQGAVQSAFNSAKGGRGKSIVDCLADEILLAARGDMTSQAVQKKEELERVAASAR
jgi:small subunit ribosomal protein S7